MFNLVTLDGYFAGRNGDISWHCVDGEFQEVAIENSNSGNTLVFGRVTYELMAAFWPTAEARKRAPRVAEGMTRAEKIVFSRTLEQVTWENTRLVSRDPAAELRKLKRTSPRDLTILGSGTLVAQLAPRGLIDEYQIMLNPVAIGAGRTLFEGAGKRIPLRLVKTRAFRNGNVLLTYTP